MHLYGLVLVRADNFWCQIASGWTFFFCCPDHKYDVFSLHLRCSPVVIILPTLLVFTSQTHHLSTVQYIFLPPPPPFFFQGGGVQYFDSGDYNTAKGKDKKDIASHPHAMALEALQNAKAPLKPKMMAEQGVLKPARRGDKGVSSLASPRKVSSVTSPLAQ